MWPLANICRNVRTAMGAYFSSWKNVSLTRAWTILNPRKRDTQKKVARPNSIASTNWKKSNKVHLFQTKIERLCNLIATTLILASLEVWGLWKGVEKIHAKTSLLKKLINFIRVTKRTRRIKDNKSQVRFKFRLIV